MLGCWKVGGNKLDMMSSLGIYSPTRETDENQANAQMMEKCYEVITKEMIKNHKELYFRWAGQGSGVRAAT